MVVQHEPMLKFQIVTNGYASLALLWRNAREVTTCPPFGALSRTMALGNGIDARADFGSEHGRNLSQQGPGAGRQCHRNWSELQQAGRVHQVIDTTREAPLLP